MSFIIIKKSKEVHEIAGKNTKRIKVLRQANIEKVLRHHISLYDVIYIKPSLKPKFLLYISQHS